MRREEPQVSEFAASDFEATQKSMGFTGDFRQRLLAGASSRAKRRISSTSSGLARPFLDPIRM
jgi:hypothetical protein